MDSTHIRVGNFGVVPASHTTAIGPFMFREVSTSPFLPRWPSRPNYVLPHRHITPNCIPDALYACHERLRRMAGFAMGVASFASENSYRTAHNNRYKEEVLSCPMLIPTLSALAGGFYPGISVSVLPMFSGVPARPAISLVERKRRSALTSTSVCGAALKRSPGTTSADSFQFYRRCTTLSDCE